jgi:hypothetical protein
MANHAKWTTKDLLNAVERLPPGEVEQLYQRVRKIRSNHRQVRAPAAEAELLAKVNRGFSEAWWNRYERLLEKRRRESLTATEHRDLLRLTNVLEKREANRLKFLVRLAHLRGCTLPELMKDLGLPRRSHA